MNVDKVLEQIREGDWVGWKDEGTFRTSKVRQVLGIGSVLVELEETSKGLFLWYLSSYEILPPF